MKRIFSCLMLLCLAAVPMFASPQRGCEIVRADYGSGNRWVDVTERVRSLAQGDAMDFRVDAATLGAATRRSRNQTLRLQLLDSRGRSRQVTFRQNEQVRLDDCYRNQSRLQITRAMYGAGNRWADVTARLRSQIQGNQLEMQVNNSTLGGDPASGQDKTLTVEYALNGRADRVVIREGDTLRLNSSMAGQGDYQGRLQITRAMYGAGNRWTDVTARLRSQIRGNQLHMQVNNDTMGGDPAQNQSKTLRVDYTFDGRLEQATFYEGDTVRLNASMAGQGNYQSRLQITRAVYGAGNRWTDVTARLNSQIRGDQLNLHVSNDTMGADPAPGQDKTLTVQYALDGRTDRVVIREGDTLRLSSSIASQGNYQSRLQITRAVYGAGNRWTDVTSRLNSQIQGDQLNMQVSNDTMGGDPAPGQDKTLSVEYALDGRREEATFNEGDTLRLSSGLTSRYPRRSSTGALASTTIPNGTELTVRTDEPIDSKTAVEGQTFSAMVAADVLDSSGAVRIPKGADAFLVIRSSDDGGVASTSDLVLDVDSVTVSGIKYLVSTGDLEQKGGEGVGANRRTAIMVGGGAALGTLIGAVAGGAKGAAIGAAIGAGAGVGAQVLTRGKEVRVPTETVLTFKLDRDLYLQAVR